ncbi:unnamed protein product, partial [Urochloa humidicola]
ASGHRRRLAERRKPVDPFSPTPVATPFVFLVGGRTLAPPHAGGRALPLLPRQRSHAKHQDRLSSGLFQHVSDNPAIECR